MDPLSIIGVTAAIQQILTSVYRFGSSVREAKTEVNQLCSELLALKAALEHVQLNINVEHFSTGMEDLGLAKEAKEILSSSNSTTPEFQQMLCNADATLKELLGRLQQKPGKFNLAIRRATWHLVKDDIKRYVDRLNRLKSWFVLATTSDNTMLCRESYLKICAIDSRLQDQEVRQERKQSSKLRQAAKKWLAPHDPHPFYQKSLEAFHEGTGKWFLDDVFQKWLDGHPPVLWLRARPGSGKTTLMSAAIKHMREKSDLPSSTTALAYFYCSFTDQSSQDLHNVFGSLLAQLCEVNPQIWSEVEDHFLKGKGPSGQDPKKMEFEVVERLLVQCSMQSRETILFLDALNESKQLSKILQNLASVLRNASNVRVVMSSTEEMLPGLVSIQATITSMGPEDISQDIARVVEARLEEDERLCDLPSALKRDIKTRLERGSDGMFRWVQCQLETLADHNTAQEIRRALDDVPTTLEHTYRAVLARIPPQQVAVAKKTLFWVAFALKPMELKELSEAIMIDEHKAMIREDMRLLRDEILLKSCGSLISYDATTTCVTLAHSSVFTYLTSPDIRSSNVHAFHLDEDTAYNSVARRCINYMLLPAFSSGACLSFPALDQRWHDWPLLRYVAETLFDHLYYITLDPPMASLLLRFFATHTHPHGGNFGAWVQACFPKATGNIENSTPLYYAARYGLLGIVRMILVEEGTKNLESKGGVYRSTPMHVAAWQGETEVVRELLKAGADPRETNDNGDTGLLWAKLSGYTELEGMLREAGAELNEEAVEMYLAMEGYQRVHLAEEEEMDDEEERKDSTI